MCVCVVKVASKLKPIALAGNERLVIIFVENHSVECQREIIASEEAVAMKRERGSYWRQKTFAVWVGWEWMRLQEEGGEEVWWMWTEPEPEERRRRLPSGE